VTLYIEIQFVPQREHNLHLTVSIV